LSILFLYPLELSRQFASIALFKSLDLILGCFELDIDLLEIVSQIVVGVFQFLILFVESIGVLQETGDLPLIFLVILKQDLKFFEDSVK